MLYRLRQRSRGEGGFTLIELLVVILIIGILAAIAIPSFLNQKSKAYDASAKELARTAETTAETYATDHNGEYTWGAKGIEELEKYESGLKACATNPPKENACLQAVAAGKASEFEVTAEAVNTGDRFTITRESSGEIKRKCVSGTKAKTGSGKNSCAGAEESSW
jgi:type IV pilus assembly protein PilA